MRVGERPAAKLMMGVVMAEGQGGAESINAVELAAELTIAWLSNSNTRVAADDVPGFLQSMHNAVSQLSNVVPKVGSAAGGRVRTSGERPQVASVEGSHR